jgi:hypothetical protein
MAGLAACAENKSIAKWHPVEVTTPVLCSKCHTDSRSTLDHLPNYIERHKFYASQQKNSCGVCHKESFCSDCHTHKEEIKPSDKYKDAPHRALPHRGDYLTQHKIDGRINPAPCFRCHGRNNNRRCIACHR